MTRRGEALVVRGAPPAAKPVEPSCAASTGTPEFREWTDFAQQTMFRLHKTGALEVPVKFTKKEGEPFMIAVWKDSSETVSEIPVLVAVATKKAAAAPADRGEDDSEEEENEDDDDAPASKKPAAKKQVLKKPSNRPSKRPAAKKQVLKEAGDLNVVIDKKTLVKKGPFSRCSYLVHQKPPKLVVEVTAKQVPNHFEVICMIYDFIKKTVGCTKEQARNKRHELLCDLKV